MSVSDLHARWTRETRSQLEEGIPGAVRTTLVARNKWSEFEKWILSHQGKKRIWYKLPEGQHSFRVAVINEDCLARCSQSH